ncbi:MAG: hypothetical protein ACI814_004066, partial [Mariniblastus sp.]
KPPSNRSAAFFVEKNIAAASQQHRSRHRLCAARQSIPRQSNHRPKHKSKHPASQQNQSAYNCKHFLNSYINAKQLK